MSDEDINENDLYFLIYDWEFYPDVLLEPSDFSNGRPDRYMEYINIGERTSMTTNSAFGKGTYRLNIILPQKPNSYMLNLPEIFNAYNLYINNDLMLKMGDIDTGKSGVQERAAMFYGGGRIQVLIAVNCTDHYYSGMVYPPSFGTPFSTNIYRGERVLISTLFISMALVCFILSLWMGISMKQKSIRMFSFLCLAIIGYTSYLPLRMFATTSGEWLYMFELGSYYAMAALVIMMQNKVCGVPKYIRRVTFTVSWLMCIAAVLYAAFSRFVSVDGREVFSAVFSVYKWFIAIHLVLSSISAVNRKQVLSGPIFFGAVFFAAAIAMDRTYLLYEPIYGGWFSETGGMVMIVVLGYTLWHDVVETYKFGLTFDAQKKQMNKQITIQKENYDRLGASIEETRKLRHDLRQHLRVMQGFINNKNFARLQEYISELSKENEVMPSVTICPNILADAILQHYRARCAKHNIDIDISFAVPEQIAISDTDFSILLGNLLENAIEACQRMESGNKMISVIGMCNEKCMKFKIKNTFSGHIQKRGQSFYSSKRNNEPGIGIRSVQSVVEKYGGIIDISNTETFFNVAVIIPF